MQGSFASQVTKEEEMTIGILSMKGLNVAGGIPELEKGLGKSRSIKNSAASFVIQIVTNMGLGERR